MIHYLLASKVASERDFSVGVLQSLQQGQVAQIEPEGDETSRMVKNSLKRTAKELGLVVTVYEDNGFVYVKVE